MEDPSHEPLNLRLGASAWHIATQDDYARFIAAFRARTLPKPAWSHPAHLAAGLWYLDEFPPPEALVRMRGDIRAYNEATGVANTDHAGYHETLTQLFLRGVQTHRRAHAGAPLLEVLRRLLRTPLARSDWPLRFYSKPHLMSVQARHHWVEPDLPAGAPADLGQGWA